MLATASPPTGRILVRRCFRSLATAAAHPGSRTPEELEAVSVRTIEVMVRAHDLTGDALVWDVYRYGRWVRGSDRS